MFIPEYTITSSILKNVAGIEHNRSYIENVNILPNFLEKLEKEATLDYIHHSFKFFGEHIDPKLIKNQLDRLSKTTLPKIDNLQNGLLLARETAATYELEEKDLKSLHQTVSKKIIPNRQLGKFRSNKLERKTDPQEILAEITELLDWFMSLDAMETNPIILAGIMKGQLETAHPFEHLNFIVSNLTSRTILHSRGYEIAKYFSPESFYNASKRSYEQNLLSIIEEEGDLTAWLEYFTEGISTQVATTAEKAKLYAKDTKLAKASGKIYLTPRQERIVEYLQDYGLLQNKQFPILFPKISEDSVLRDLKKLVNTGIVVKRGSTKLSRYELR